MKDVVTATSGSYYNSLEQYDKAILHHGKKPEHCKSRLETRQVKDVVTAISVTVYNSLEQYDKAIQHHEKNRNIAKQIGDKAGEGRSYSNLGNCYNSLEQYDKAIQHHERSLNIAEQIGDKAGEGT